MRRSHSQPPDADLQVSRQPRYAAGAGQEEDIKAFAARIREQIKHEAAKALEDAARKLADPKH